MATFDARLVALDAKTGDVKWTKQIADPEAGYTETQAPIISDNKVLIGISGAEYGIRGFVRAYDKATGEQVWNTYTIPDQGMGREVGGEDVGRATTLSTATLPRKRPTWRRIPTRGSAVAARCG